MKKIYFINRSLKNIILLHLVFSIIFISTIFSFNSIVVSAPIELSDGGDNVLIQINNEPETQIDDTSTSPDTSDNDLKDTSTDTSYTDTTIQQPQITDESSTIDENEITSSDYDTSSSDIYQKSIDNSYILESEIIENSSIDSINYNDSNYLEKVSIDNIFSNERIVLKEEILSTTENKIGNISYEQTKEVLTGNITDISSVELTPSKDLENVEVKIINLKDKPEVVSEPEKKNISIYRYLDIKITSNNDYIMESDIKSLSFNFKVEYTWLENNKIDKLSIELLRYHDGEWQNLSTELINENETCLFFTAESLGCSTFAIVGSKVVEKQESGRVEGASIPWSIIIIVILLLSIILVIVLIKARYIYVEESNTED